VCAGFVLHQSRATAAHHRITATLSQQQQQQQQQKTAVNVDMLLIR